MFIFCWNLLFILLVFHGTVGVCSNELANFREDDEYHRAEKLINQIHVDLFVLKNKVHNLRGKIFKVLEMYE